MGSMNARCFTWAEQLTDYKSGVRPISYDPNRIESSFGLSVQSTTRFLCKRPTRWDFVMDDPTEDTGGVRVWFLAFSDERGWFPTSLGDLPVTFACNCIETLLKEATPKNRQLNSWMFPALKDALSAWHKNAQFIAN
jgi:hypothetical protein